MRRARPLVLLVGALLALLAAPAAADPAVPTNYDSRVTSTPPAGVTAEVAGGDAFLVLRVEPGTTVEVPGYVEEEEFLRFGPDGTVEVNRAGQAIWISEDRYGGVPPQGTGPDATPRWEVVAEGGAYAWHDHRIHWMSPRLPDQVDPSGGEQEVFTWSVPLVVDGEPTTVDGVLRWQPTPLPVVPLGAALVAALLAWAVARRGLVPAALVAALGGVVVLGVFGFASDGAVPGVDAATPPLLAPALAVVVAVLAVAVGRRPPAQRRGLVLLAAVALVATSALSYGWLTAPQLPVALPDLPFRLALATGLGAGLGVLAGLLLARGGADVAVHEHDPRGAAPPGAA